ncbi:hypothetical protein JTY60_00450 [symbiont of Argiope bruennichi]|uniref:hypothetical protein n=1 Tax=symbiont of Argiope bruennichi TaxID=2810479 RepID=UPI003DA61131
MCKLIIYFIWNPINGCTCNSGIPIRYWWGYAFYITSEQCKTALKDLDLGEGLAAILEKIMGDIPYLGVLITLAEKVGIPYVKAIMHDDAGCGVVWDVSWSLIINWFHKQGEYCII